VNYYFLTDHRSEEPINDEIIDVALVLNDAIEMRKKCIQGRHFWPWEMPVEIKEVQDSLTKDPNEYRREPYPHPTYDPFDITNHDPQLKTNEDFEMVNGVMKVYPADNGKKSPKKTLFPVISFNEHYADFKRLSMSIFHAPTKSFCYNRLKSLELKFTLYTSHNESEELIEQKKVSHRDFYNVRKVDTHIHMASAMNQKHLLRFIKKKLKTSPNEVVIFRDGKKLTLAEVFKSLNLTSYQLSVDTLDVHADKNLQHRFDKFNSKYNPLYVFFFSEIINKS
jgi:AMP deaminase